jgi:hypothetical protein
MEGHLTDGDRERLRRQSGMSALATRRGLELFDAALGTGVPLVLPVDLDLEQHGDAEIPYLLSELVRPAGPYGSTTARADGADQGADGPASLPARLAAMSPGDRKQAVLTLVRAQVASTLGHSGPPAVALGTEFRALGFDSLTGIELRNRLNRVTGLRLPATVVFDHPTPTALASAVLALLVPAEPTPVPASGAADGPDDPDGPDDVEGPDDVDRPDDVDGMDVEELLRLARRRIQS